MQPSKQQDEQARRTRSCSNDCKPSTLVEVFKAMASLSLLPKCAWGLNKELQRDVKLTVKVNATRDTPCTVLRKILESKLVSFLRAYDPLPQLDLTGSIRVLQLWRIRGVLVAMPSQLHSVMLEALPDAAAEDLAALLKSLPGSVRNLSFGSFGSSCRVHAVHMTGVDVALPPHLETLELGGVELQRCKFPASLTSTTLTWCSLPAALQLPEPLTTARFEHIEWSPPPAAGSSFTLPDGLRELKLEWWGPDWAIAPLPHGLVRLNITYCQWATHGGLMTPALAPLPHALEVLTVSTGGDAADSVHPILGQLPQCLTVLDLRSMNTFNSALGLLPPSLTSLRLGSGFTQALGELPESLTELRLARNPYVIDEDEYSLFDQPLGRLPPAMQVLDLDSNLNFNHTLGCLPVTLRELRLGEAFDHPLQKLPPALEVLELGDAFRQEVQPELPSTLRMFRMGARFNVPVALPASLEKVYIVLLLECGGQGDATNPRDGMTHAPDAAELSDSGTTTLGRWHQNQPGFARRGRHSCSPLEAASHMMVPAPKRPLLFGQ
ncbi:hypothetical protein JKP88DRAFT_315896 [Tribonema minus]|uniref:Uncharacterized protein n=1 Tax=Tribonema minus TaxID=303371 RepID=A0A835Z7T3_9STRA|nr:hypothetical protein JKP88DRAFT_315896 [Tribonema minus]